MNKFLISSLLVVYAICNVHSLQFLLNICENDIIRYNNLTVNSVYPLSLAVWLKPIQDYTINQTVNYEDHFDSKTANELYSLRNFYNSELSELFSEQFMNRKNFTVDYKKVSLFQKCRSNLTTHSSEAEDKQAKAVLDDAIKMVVEGEKLGMILYKRREELIDPMYTYSKLAMKDKIKELASKSDPKIETFAFQNKAIDEIYEEHIYHFHSFELFVPRNLKDLLDPKIRRTATLYSEIWLPFENKNYNSSETNCQKKENLPLFFHLK